MAAKKEIAKDIEENVQEEAPQKERTVRISLPYDENAGDEFVSVNDRTWLIQRGVEVEVPYCVYEVLRERDRALMKARAAAESFKA